MPPSARWALATSARLVGATAATTDTGGETSGADTGSGTGTSSEGDGAEAAIALDVAISGFVPDELEAHEGEIALTLENLDAFPHDFTIDELGVKLVVEANASVSGSFTATPGVYEFYCSVPGHKEAGMVGTLTVLPGAEH